MDRYDVAVIGAGVIGSAAARELSRYALKTIVLEKGPDVASGSSKANSGIVHAGYDAKHGTLKAKYNILGQRMYEKLSETLDFPFSRCGSLVLAFDEGDIPDLEALKENGEKNGLTDLSVIGREDILKIEPNISDRVCAALHVPSGGIVCPYEMTIAFAENACQNGVEFKFECEALSIRRISEGFVIETSEGPMEAKVIVNAAGLFSDNINNMVSDNKIEIVPRRGEYCLLDKSEQGLVRRTLFQLPTKMGKGILVTPTVDGNTLIGPTSVDIDDKTNLSTTPGGLAEVLATGGQSVKSIPGGKIITSFTGLRAHSTGNDFIIGEAADVPGFINAAGIESPGLTAAPAIGAEIAAITAKILNPQLNQSFNPRRKAPPKFRHLNNDEKNKLIAENPDYGTVICRCETVTKGEILDALRSPLRIKDIDAVKRRTRTGMGRCQSGFCNMKIIDIISEELGIDRTQVTKAGSGTNLLLEKNKVSL